MFKKHIQVHTCDFINYILCCQESAFKLAIELINEEAAIRNSKVNLSIDFSCKSDF